VRKTLVLLVFLCCPSLVPSWAWTGETNQPANCKVWASFSSEGSIGETILQEIRQARSRLSVALYAVNNLVMVEELAKLAGEGIKIRAKIDKKRSMRQKRNMRAIEILKSAGISVQLVGQEGKNHNKFIVIDGAKVITGSYNWTVRAEQNWENILVLDCPKLAKQYEREWEEIR